MVVQHIVQQGSNNQMTNDENCEAVLRRVLEVQLGLKNLKLEDNLLFICPEIPQDEILMDVFEEFGFYWERPDYDEWTGSFKELLSIAEINLSRMKNNRSIRDYRG